MIAAGTLIPVELSGGAMDGHRTEVLALVPPCDTYLFSQIIGRRKFTLAYVFASRSCNKGRHWVLDFIKVVGCVTLSAGTSNTGGCDE